MSLQDVCTNTARSSNSMSRIHRKAPSSSSNSVLSGPLPPPRAVQSMLRTGTEMGGAFGIPQSAVHVPHRGTRLQSTRYRSGSFDTSFASALRHQRSPRMRSERIHNSQTSKPRRHDTVPSDPTPHPRTSARRLNVAHIRHPEPRKNPSFEADAHRIYSYRSLTSLRSQGVHEDTHPKYASSYVHVGDMEFNSPRISARTNNTTTNGYATRSLPYKHARQYTASPRASLAARRGVPVHNLYMNRSISSLQNRQSPKVPGRFSSQPFVSSTSGSLPEVDESCYHGSESQAPRYYDYSESFAEGLSLPNNRCVDDSPNTRTKTVAVEVEGSLDLSKGHPSSGTQLGSALNPAELPTHGSADAGKAAGLVSENQVELLSTHRSPGEWVTAVELPAGHLASIEYEGDSFDLPELISTSRVSSTGLHCASFPSNFDISLPYKEKSLLDLAASTATNQSPLCGATTFTRLALPQISVRPQLRPARSVDVIFPTGKHIHSIASSISLPLIADLNIKPPQLDHRFTTQNLMSEAKHPISSRSRGKVFNATNVEERGAYDLGQTVELLGSLPDITGDADANGGEKDMSLANLCPPGSNSQDCPSPSGKPVALDGLLTPQRDTILSIVGSHGKSTVDLLLEKHIESLGLGPEPSTSSESSEEASMKAIDVNVGDIEFEPLFRDKSTEACKELPVMQNASERSISCISTEARLALKPRRLFASSDIQLPVLLDFMIPQSKPSVPGEHRLHRRRSDGWLALSSSIQSQLFPSDSKPTLGSGEMADIDTEVFPPGRKIWTLSQLSLPTSWEGPEMSYETRDTSNDYRVSVDKIFARYVHHQRRRVRIQLKRQSMSNDFSRSCVRKTHDDNRVSATDEPEKHHHSDIGLAELDGSQSTVSHRLKRNAETNGNAMGPRRWSSLVAAPPISGPALNVRRIPRRASTRTHRSQRSQNSQTGLLDPFNSTRQRSDLPRLGSVIPRLPAPDLGPVLNTSTLNLSIPYAEAPSTIYPSHRGTRSFFEDSPSRLRVLQRSVKRQLGMRPMRVITPQRAASTTVKANLPMRNGIPIAPVGPSIGMAMRRHSLRRPPLLMQGAVPPTDITYKKKSVVEKVKGWWKRQCIQKTLVTRKKTQNGWMPGGVLV